MLKRCNKSSLIDVKRDVVKHVDSIKNVYEFLSEKNIPIQTTLPFLIKQR